MSAEIVITVDPGLDDPEGEPAQLCRLGHASAAVTLDVYSHLWPDSEDRTRQAVDQVLGAGVEDLVRTERLV